MTREHKEMLRETLIDYLMLLSVPTHTSASRQSIDTKMANIRLLLREVA